MIVRNQADTYCIEIAIEAISIEIDKLGLSNCKSSEQTKKSAAKKVVCFIGSQFYHDMEWPTVVKWTVAVSASVMLKSGELYNVDYFVTHFGTVKIWEKTG